MKEDVIKIGVREMKNEQLKHFHFLQNTPSYLELGVLLNNMECIKKSPGKYPRGMFFGRKSFEFFLEKEETLTWEDILPQIKVVMENYFKKEIELVLMGPYFNPLYTLYTGPGMNFLSPGYEGQRTLNQPHKHLGFPGSGEVSFPN
jgi:hypothetical protein